MLTVHVGPTNLDDPLGRVYAAPHGRASILFVFVAGVGVTLLGSSRRTSTSAARLTLAWRALLLLPLGLALQLLDHGAFVILQDYAVLFLLGLVVLRLDDRALLGLAVAVAAVGPLAHISGHLIAPGAFERDPITLSDPVADIAHGLVLSGPYPLIVWAAPFLFGMWLGRRDLRAARVRRRLLGWGAAATLTAVALSLTLIALFGEPVGDVGWDHLVDRSPHSQMPLWLLGSTGSAAFVLGVALHAAEAAPRLAWPLVATGQLALTVYVGHLLALHAAPDALTSTAVGGATLRVLAFALVAAAASTAWRAAFDRGPLEAGLRGPWELTQRRG